MITTITTLVLITIHFILVYNKINKLNKRVKELEKKNQPVKAYVKTSDKTSQQELDIKKD